MHIKHRKNNCTNASAIFVYLNLMFFRHQFNILFDHSLMSSSSESLWFQRLSLTIYPMHKIKMDYCSTYGKFFFAEAKANDSSRNIAGQ